ncbi:MAG: pitrilysin family protein [Patescibacteria group bacterium]|nr:pitrilysin family protein [Patescibacteria group bacterium]MDD5164700.1 pitrilysin family protein [Patescibacteria group bacterium]MDD5534176.1 pitrilysin family protein [Patescibacteria group bacterium]
MYFQTKLSQGLRLITVPVKNAESVTIEVLLPVGSRYETKDLNGASHFIEHMMFKGTKRRPSSLLVAKELDSLGARYNAFTSKDHTGYWIKAVDNKTEKAFDILSDMVFNSVFDKEEFEREKKVILEEVKMYEENPLLHIEDMFEKVLFGNHPLSWLVSGDMPTVQKMSQQKLMAYKEKFYQPNQMIVVVAGNIKNQEAIKLVKKYFGAYQGKKNKTDFSLFKNEEKKSWPKANILFKDTNQVQIALGGLAYSYHHPDLEAASVLSLILGGNMSSRLFTEIRVKRGLAYFVEMELGVYQDTGSFEIRAGVDKNRTEETLKVILEELNKIKKQGVSKEELTRAKDYIEGTMKLSFEESATLASWYGRQLLLVGKIIEPKEKLKKIKMVSQSDIQRIANQLFKNKNLSLAMIGPFKENRQFLRILQDEI